MAPIDIPYLQAIGLEKNELVQALGLSFTVSTVALTVNILAEGGVSGAMAGTNDCCGHRRVCRNVGRPSDPAAHASDDLSTLVLRRIALARHISGGTISRLSKANRHV